MRGTAPAVPLLASAGRALVHGLLKLVLYGLALGSGSLLTAVTGVGSLVGVAWRRSSWPTTASTIRWRDERDLRREVGYLVRHPLQTVGFGLGHQRALPRAARVLVAPPFAAVGATLAFLGHQSGAAAGRARRSAATARPKPTECRTFEHILG